MRRSKRDLEIFSLSFLDIISCGFGAVVILILVSSNSKLPMPNTVEEASALLKEVINRKKIVEDLQYQLANEINDVASQDLILQNTKNKLKKLSQRQKSIVNLSENLQQDLAGLKLVQETVQQMSKHMFRKLSKTIKTIKICETN